MIIDQIGIFHTRTIADQLPDFEVIETNYIPNWACLDWKLYCETICQILFFKLKENQTASKVTISVSFKSFTDNMNITQNDLETEWGYLITKIDFAGDRISQIELQGLRDLLQIPSATSDKYSCKQPSGNLLSILASKALVTGTCGAFSFHKSADDGQTLKFSQQVRDIEQSLTQQEL